MATGIAQTLAGVTKKHVLTAIKKMNKSGVVPKRRNSTKFSVLYQRTLYPPKYLLCLAVQVASGRKLIPDEHSGGAQSNSCLSRLGFQIVPTPSNFVER